MWASIAHRATGLALYAAAVVLAGWAFALAAGPETYGRCRAILGSPPGRLLLIAITLSLFYHLADGLRRLVWDFGFGFQLKTANASAAAVIIFAALATVGVWTAAAMTGAFR
jgi:succinate dehydrogenase / fumarate reductase cytochrome b subunit